MCPFSPLTNHHHRHHISARTCPVTARRFGYTLRERIFYALAWSPKATVQAALSGGQRRRPWTPRHARLPACPPSAARWRWRCSALPAPVALDLFIPSVVPLPRRPAAAPLALIQKYKSNEPNYDEWLKWGDEILVRLGRAAGEALPSPTHRSPGAGSRGGAWRTPFLNLRGCFQHCRALTARLPCATIALRHHRVPLCIPGDPR